VTPPTATSEPTGTALPTMQPVTATVVPQTPTATATGVVVLPSTGTGPLGGGRTMALNLGALIASATILAAAGFVIAEEHRQR
jgi:hypothetical protein